MLDMTFEQGQELFIAALGGSNFSKETVRAYKADLKQFKEYLASVRVDWNLPTKITRIDIVEFMNRLNSRERSGKTRARKLATIRHFLKFLQENNVISGNPAETIKRAKSESREAVFLYKNEYKALLFEAQENKRDFAILTVFLQTGIRESELTHLKIGDVDLEHGSLTVRQGKGKIDRTIPLEPQATTALKDYLPERQKQLIIDEDILFLARNGTSLNERTIRKLVKKYYDKAGVKKRGVHTLRHTYGAHKTNNGLAIPILQKFMGHKRRETTLNYIHIVNTSLKQAQADTAL